MQKDIHLVWVLLALLLMTFGTAVVSASGTNHAALQSVTCPCSLWDDTAVPSIESAADFSPIELGVKFQSTVAGSVTGMRFYKGSLNTGTHTGNLWAADGTLLAMASFTNETATGWQQVDFAAPVEINPDTTYVASYHTTSGGYAVDGTYFAFGGVEAPPLRALGNGIDGGNGVFRYGASGYPQSSANASNYWVDVVFMPDTTALSLSSTTVTGGGAVMFATMLGMVLALSAASLSVYRRSG